MKVRTKPIEFEVYVGFTPAQLHFKKYVFPQLIIEDEEEKIFEEEMIAWFISHSITANQWVAVSQKDFDFSLQEARSIWDSSKKILRANQLKKEKMRKKWFEYLLKSIISFGIYAIICKYPTLDPYDVPLNDIESSLIKLEIAEFHQALKETYYKICKKGLIQAQTINGEIWIFPTDKLFELLKKQL